MTTLVTEARNIKYNKRTDCEYPNLTAHNLIPINLRVVTLVTDKEGKETEVDSKNIIISFSNNAELPTYSEAYFHNNNVIDLSDYRGIIRKTGKLAFQLTNKHPETHNYRMYLGYEHSNGCVIWDETVTSDFDTITSKIASIGRCTLLTITSNKPLETIKMLPTVVSSSDDDDHVWELTGFEVEGHGQQSGPETYVFDFTSPDMKIYSEKLRYLRLQVKDKDQQNALILYISAQGFKS